MNNLKLRLSLFTNISEIEALSKKMNWWNIAYNPTFNQFAEENDLLSNYYRTSSDFVLTGDIKVIAWDLDLQEGFELTEESAGFSGYEIYLTCGLNKIEISNGGHFHFKSKNELIIFFEFLYNYNNSSNSHCIDLGDLYHVLGNKPEIILHRKFSTFDELLSSLNSESFDKVNAGLFMKKTKSEKSIFEFNEEVVKLDTKITELNKGDYSLLYTMSSNNHVMDQNEEFYYLLLLK